MKTLYLECKMGAAGDMLMASLLELLPDRQAFIDKINSIGIPGVRVSASEASKCGITGTHMEVLVNGIEEHEYFHMLKHQHEHHQHESINAETGEHASRHNGHDGAHHHSHEHDHDHAHTYHHHGHSHDDGTGYAQHQHDHPHTGMHEIGHIIESLAISDRVRADVKAVYGLIAEAEGHAHGIPADEVHFHEVGAMDAITDITGVCLLMEMLDPDMVITSPVHVGSGHVHCTHGTLPVPAPATAYILRGIPTYSDGSARGELCTPTGAALLKHFTDRFSEMPVMTVSDIGYGMGMKDFAQANCVRAMLGYTDTAAKDTACELHCNLDDMTPEMIAFAASRLMDAGALDVWTEAIGMKKNRPGIKLCCLCSSEDREKMLHLIFKHTTTIGIREHSCTRYILNREASSLNTGYGTVRAKRSEGYGTVREKPEFEAIAELALKHDVSIMDILKSMHKDV